MKNWAANIRKWSADKDIVKWIVIIILGTVLGTVAFRLTNAAIDKVFEKPSRRPITIRRG